MDVSSSRSWTREKLNDVIKGVIKVLITVVFLGTILIWIMMPTQTYWNVWSPALRSKLGNSTYFGPQGTNLVLFMCPMIFMASVGCVYLHLKQRERVERDTDKVKRGKLEGLRKPMLVKGPLGIVSFLEFGFLIMFLALLVWSLGIHFYNRFAFITAHNGEELWQARLHMVGLWLGLVGNIGLAFLFLPVARGSSLLQLVGLTSESSIKYHIWLGHLVLSLFTAHGLCYTIYWASTDHVSKMIEWASAGISNVAGEIALAAGLVMWVTTYPAIRRRFFEVFFYTHYLYIVFFLFFVFHVGFSYSLISFPGVYLFIVDRFLRFLQSRTNVRLISARILSSDTVELNFAKNPRLMYSPTSTLFVNIPSISKLQWHPFTISSSSNLEPEKLSVVIKSEGKWTTKLYQILSSSPIDRLPVSVEGPYGPVSTDFLRYESLVMVSGGSGITPFISIIRDLIAASKTQTQTRKVPKVTLICAFKNSSDLSMLDLILPSSGTPIDISADLNLQVEAFVTREKEPVTETTSTKKTRTLWFKPSLSDKPISAILGPNSWLWLGAILSSSFLIFIIVMGLITRFHIYPIDHNTNRIYSSPIKSMLYVLVLCVSVMVTSTAAVLWNKKKHGAIEGNQVQNVTVPTQATDSPSSWAYNAEREIEIEIESSPQQALAQCTNLHFGQRPDLKKILTDMKDSSVGVMVCGPKKMRHEVATICSSGSSKNLHFESISFSW